MIAPGALSASAKRTDAAWVLASRTRAPEMASLGAMDGAGAGPVPDRPARGAGCADNVVPKTVRHSLSQSGGGTRTTQAGWPSSGKPRLESGGAGT